MPLEALYVVGIGLLFAALAYGVYRSKTRNKANDPIREEAVKELYEQPRAYEQGGKQELERKLKPEN